MTTFRLDCDPELVETKENGTLVYICKIRVSLANGVEAFNPSGVLIEVPANGTLLAALMVHAQAEADANAPADPGPPINVTVQTSYNADTGAPVT